MDWAQFLKAYSLTAPAGGVSAAGETPVVPSVAGGIQPGGGSATGGGAFDAGVMATHGGMSNAAGGAGDPSVYAGSPDVEMDPKMASMFKNLAGLGLGMMSGGEEQPQKVIPAMRSPTAGTPATFQPSVAGSNAGFYNRVMQMLGK